MAEVALGATNGATLSAAAAGRRPRGTHTRGVAGSTPAATDTAQSALFWWLQARVDRLALESEDAETALVHATKRLAANEPLERLDPERELAGGK